MLFKEAKEILNNKGYKLVESEFRDPSTYASFYYPPDSPDTEKYEQNAQEKVGEVLNLAMGEIEDGLKEKYPNVKVSFDNENGITSKDSDYYDGKDEWYYTEIFSCELKIEVPIKTLNLSLEDAEDEKILDTSLEKFFNEVIKPLNKTKKLKFDTLWSTELSNDEDYGIMSIVGEYKYYEGDSRY